MNMSNSIDGTPYRRLPCGELEGTVEDRVDALFETIGGGGLFQVFAYLAIAWGMSAPCWFIYEVGYFTQAPD